MITPFTALNDSTSLGLGQGNYPRLDKQGNICYDTFRNEVHRNNKIGDL